MAKLASTFGTIRQAFASVGSQLPAPFSKSSANTNGRSSSATAVVIDKMNELVDRYHETSRPIYCAQQGFVDEIDRPIDGDGSIQVSIKTLQHDPHAATTNFGLDLELIDPTQHLRVSRRIQNLLPIGELGRISNMVTIGQRWVIPHLAIRRHPGRHRNHQGS